MKALPLGVGSYDRSTVPRMRLVNRIMERAPTPDGVVLLTRPVLSPFATVGAGPIRGMGQRGDVFNGDALVVSGGAARRVSTAGIVSASLGSITGSGRVIVSMGVGEAMIATGSTLYNYNGTTLAAETFPDGADVTWITWANDYWLAVRRDSQLVYYKSPGGAWAGLDVVSAEADPDRLRAVVQVNDQLWMIGTDSIEGFYFSGQATPLIRRFSGRVYSKGCRSEHSIVVADNTLVWVHEDNERNRGVYRGGGTAERISTNTVEEAMLGTTASAITAWTFGHIGHEFYVLRIGTERTFVYDFLTKQWSEWESPGDDYWRAHIGTSTPDGVALAGDDTNGDLYSLTSTTAMEEGVGIEREAMAHLPLRGTQTERCNRVTLECTPGDYELQVSDNDGASYRSIGPMAALRKNWSRLGLMRAPGRLFRVVDDNNAPTRVSGLIVE